MVKVSDGTLFSIAHIGTLLPPSPQHPLSLQKILHVPKLQHNLLSIRQLYRDNHCTFEFDYFSIHVKDNTMGDVLLQASSSSHVYAVPISLP